jgi:hypothetical protein
MCFTHVEHSPDAKFEHCDNNPWFIRNPEHHPACTNPHHGIGNNGFNDFFNIFSINARPSSSLNPCATLNAHTTADISFLL